jgi:hypothetical protein
LGGRLGLASEVEVDIKEASIDDALSEVLSRLPAQAFDLPTLRSISSKKTAKEGSYAGLTRRITYEKTIRLPGRAARSGEAVVQKIEFYRDIMEQLTPAARVAVVAHEFAHAWLNDHVGPEESKKREEESDSLAREWGFGKELDELADETY